MPIKKLQTCTRCKSKKEITKFNIRKNVSNGRASHCKDCIKETKKIYRRTKRGVISTIYEGQCSHSKTRGHSRPKYTKEWLLSFLLSDIKFHLLYDNWVDSGYDKIYKPSIDRINDFKGYSVDNIQLMTWGENDKKGRNDAFNSKGTRGLKSKAVDKLTLDEEYICTYDSMASASRDTDIKTAVICRACKGLQRKAGGYKWRYSDGIH